jgi:nicotinate dehydrogenase subunit A
MAAHRFTLNGTPRTFTVRDEREPLLYVLRNAAGLTGPKFGCGLGQCGACMVLVDGKAVRSCTLPMSAVDGKAVTTIEGLGTPEKPHRVQRAFIAVQAAQCGYCTNGMVMSVAALLQTKAKPSLDEAKQALAGNLCRCGSHHRVLRAVMLASDQSDAGV